MAITIEKSRTIPAVEFKYVHLNEFKCNVIENEDSSVRYEIYVDIVLYAKQDGKRVFDRTSQKKITVEDYLQFAEEEAAKGNTQPASLISDFESIVARYIENTMDLGTVEVYQEYIEG